ncbi:hypothetical protein NL676_025158 [Syzygium grande]|nr:hypothetical protein NL676_025158 [Syzygium grande]
MCHSRQSSVVSGSAVGLGRGRVSCMQRLGVCRANEKRPPSRNKLRRSYCMVGRPVRGSGITEKSLLHLSEPSNDDDDMITPRSAEVSALPGKRRVARPHHTAMKVCSERTAGMYGSQFCSHVPCPYFQRLEKSWTVNAEPADDALSWEISPVWLPRTRCVRARARARALLWSCIHSGICTRKISPGLEDIITQG